MIRINKLYTEPFTFDIIEFFPGINLVLGEKSDGSNKTNGVGKTLLIEFINFCLLKDFRYSRLSKISENDFSHDIKICLDFNINNHNIIIKRTIGAQSCPQMIINKKWKEFSNLDDALMILTGLLYETDKENAHPSFRSMLGLLIRDERSEFKSLVDCYDTKLKIPADLTPHLYLLDLDINAYKDAKSLQKSIDEISVAKNKLKKDIETLTGKKISDAKIEVNDLKSQVEHIKKEIEMLESDKSFDYVSDELNSLENEVIEYRRKRAIIKSELNKINILAGDNYIDNVEVVELYNKFKSGLGDAIKKELSEVISFKETIDKFQRNLIDARKESLKRDLNLLAEKIENIKKEHSSRMKIINQDGKLKSLKMTVMLLHKKTETYSQLSSFIDKFDDYDSKIKMLKAERSGKIITIICSIDLNKTTINNFEETILTIHEYVMGNRKSSFTIKATEKKEVVTLELRIDTDGSHSNEREKVFFYDMALMLTDETLYKHPKLLIHDNIFDVDQDTLIKSLNFLAEKSSCLKDCQYILTLNSDKINEIDKENLQLDIDMYKRISLTKNNKFLGKSYQEI